MSRMVEVRTELESILVEQALAMARELELASDAALDGQVLAVSEALAIKAGRELTRRALQATLRRQAEPAEKKGLPADPALAAAVASSKIKRPVPR
jgi:hypothetical protein